MKRISFKKGSWALIPALIISLASIFVPSVTSANGNSTPIEDAGFEDGLFTGWDKGDQTGTLGNTITLQGTGVTIFTGSRTFTHGSRGAVGSPSSPYYAPAVNAGSWTFSPNSASNAVALQPKGEQSFNQAVSALELSNDSVTEIRNMLTSQAQASGYGQGQPTDAAWITREVELTADITYTMAWNYIGTDYVPFNDGSITSLAPVDVSETPVITVNNYIKPYALLGFTNPGTGDYSTNSFGSTGWQNSTYKVSESGTYKLGFASFNLDDQGWSPLLMVDSVAGSTQRCAQNGSDCAVFGGVEPNNETAPTAPPTTTEESTSTTESTTTTSTTTTTTTSTIPPANYLEVTSLLDDGSSGTLRWAINQANANAGGIYDAITIVTQGTITLTADLPAITQGVTITGTGMATTIIDGNNSFRPIYNNGQREIVISNMTLKNGKNASGGLVWANQGTFTITNVKFSDTPNYAWYQQNQTVTTFNGCFFVNNYAGIRSDYSHTPETKSLTDTDYPNRIYINNSQFLNNSYGLATERFVKIENSIFSNNTQVAAQLQGLHRQQVYGSTFTNNGVGVSLASWIPTSWTPGADNQLVEGNTFYGNATAIQFANRFNNGQTVFNGVNANSWSTSRNNTFEENTVIYSGSDFIESNNTVVTTTTTTTTIATITTTVVINTPEPPVIEYPTINTTVELPEPSEPLPEIEVVIEEPAITVPEFEPIDSILEEVEVDTSLPDFEIIDTEIIEPAIIDTFIPEFEIVITEEALTEEQVGQVIDEIMNAPLEDVIYLIDTLSVEQLDQVFEEVSVEQLTEILDSLSAEEVLGVIENIESVEALENVIDAISEETIDPDTAIAVIENGNFEELPAEQVAAVFAAIEPDQFTEEQKSDLAAVLTEAPAEVKESFEEEIDIYGDGFDDYVPTGSDIDVGTRKTVLAAAAAAATVIAGASSAGSSSGGSSGGSGGGSGGSGGSSGGEGRSRREEDSGDEPSGEIAGPEDDDGEEFTKNSIFKYYVKEGEEMKKFNWFGFTKKMWDITAALVFTLAGSFVVYITLSGTTQRLAGISTVIAILVHYVHEILKNDE